MRVQLFDAVLSAVLVKGQRSSKDLPVCAQSRSYSTPCDPRTCQAPLFMGLSRQEHWSGLPFPIPGDLPNPGIESRSPVSTALAGGFFTTEHLGSPSDSRGLANKRWSIYTMQ